MVRHPIRRALGLTVTAGPTLPFGADRSVEVSAHGLGEGGVVVRAGDAVLAEVEAGVEVGAVPGGADKPSARVVMKPQYERG